MPEIMVTNVETVEDGNVRFYGRTEDGDHDTITVTDFQPYFYTPVTEVAAKQEQIQQDERILNVKGTEKTAQVTGKKLARVEVENHWEVQKVASIFDEHYEADVWPDNRIRIDEEIYTGVRAPRREVTQDQLEPVEMDVEPRVMTFDIEVDERGLDFDNLGENRILSIVAHDSVEDEYIGFMDGGGRPIEEMFPNGCPDELDALHVESTERAMLIRFATWVDARNPDLITGWNSSHFDVPYLVKRMENVCNTAARLSREGYCDVNQYGDVTIKGRTLYDMLEVYKKNRFSELRSYKLDHVANVELGQEKITHEQGYFEMWEDDPELLMDYNAMDVKLTVEIDRETDAISFRDSIRREIGTNFEDSLNSSDFIEMMARRKLHDDGLAGRTTDYSRDPGDYEGAYVFPPYEGVAKNVVGIDLASLYPNTMAMINAGSESKVTLSEKQKLDLTEGDELGTAVAPNGACFDLGEETVLSSLVEDALGLKAEYKELLQNAEPGSEEQEEYEERYNVSKTIVNSLYGVVGWEKFFMYDEDVAEAVTLMGQACIKRTAKYVNEETEAEVIYGDTDSNYIKFPDEYTREECLVRAEEICQELNEEVYAELAEEHGIPGEDHRWEIEIEAYFERFFQPGRKKRYAYRCTWKEGMDFDESMDKPKYSVTGMNSERSDVSQLTVDMEKEILRAILDGEDQSEITSIVNKYAKKIDPSDPDWDYIGIPGGFGKSFSEYDSPTAHVRAALNANEVLDVNIDSDDKPMRCYLQDGGKHGIDVIAYNGAEDLKPVEDEITMDAGRMTDVCIKSPMESTLEAIGIDVDAALKGQTQQGLGAFM